MLRKVNLELTVLDYDRIGGSDAIGKVLLGYNRKKLEKKHWAEMVDNPRRPVIHWHVLQVTQSDPRQLNCDPIFRIIPRESHKRVKWMANIPISQSASHLP